jgi:hypothetical protein
VPVYVENVVKLSALAGMDFGVAPDRQSILDSRLDIGVI